MRNTTTVPKLRFPEFNEAWTNKKLGEIAKFFSGGTPVTGKEQYYNGEIPFIKSGEINSPFTAQTITQNGLQSSSAKLVKKGDVLYALYGATSGEVAISKIDGAINQAVLCIRSQLNSAFLLGFLRRNKETIISTYLQGGQGNLSAEIVKSLRIYYPSLPEQQKIATFLSAVDDKIMQLQKKKELLEHYKTGVMQRIFNQEIRFKDDDGNEYPNWETKKLGEIANFRRGSFPQPYGLPKWYDLKGEPFIQVYDVGDNMLLKTTTKSKISDAATSYSVFASKGTLVITIQGSIGRIAKMQYDAYVDRTLLIFQSYKIPVDVDYFKYVVYLLFEIEKTKAPGGTIKTITKQVLTNFVVQIPRLEEQTKIAEILAAIDIKVQLVNKQLRQTKQFKNGLLQQMFA